MITVFDIGCLWLLFSNFFVFMDFSGVYTHAHISEPNLSFLTFIEEWKKITDILLIALEE